MELALELVNHVSPATADRLLDRLRTAEAALVEAEKRHDAVRRRASQPGGDGRLGGVAVAVLLVVLVVAVIGFLCVMRPNVTGLVDAEPMECKNAANWTGPEDDGTDPPWLTDAVDNSEDVCISSACALVLEEARADEAALQRSHEELQAGYNEALQAMGSWISFVREVAQPNAKRREGSSLRSACIDASIPGRQALRKLLKSIQSPADTSLPTVAEQLSQHLRRMEELNPQATRAQHANSHIPGSFR